MEPPSFLRVAWAPTAVGLEHRMKRHEDPGSGPLAYQVLFTSSEFYNLSSNGLSFFNTYPHPLSISVCFPTPRSLWCIKTVIMPEPAYESNLRDSFSPVMSSLEMLEF